MKSNDNTNKQLKTKYAWNNIKNTIVAWMKKTIRIQFMDSHAIWIEIKMKSKLNLLQITRFIKYRGEQNTFTMDEFMRKNYKLTNKTKWIDCKKEMDDYIS